jgi:hypothetical protein
MGWQHAGASAASDLAVRQAPCWCAALLHQWVVSVLLSRCFGVTKQTTLDRCYSVCLSVLPLDSTEWSTTVAGPVFVCMRLTCVSVFWVYCWVTVLLSSHSLWSSACPEAGPVVISCSCMRLHQFFTAKPCNIYNLSLIKIRYSYKLCTCPLKGQARLPNSYRHMAFLLHRFFTARPCNKYNLSLI